MAATVATVDLLARLDAPELEALICAVEDRRDVAPLDELAALAAISREAHLELGRLLSPA